MFAHRHKTIFKRNSHTGVEYFGESSDDSASNDNTKSSSNQEPSPISHNTGNESSGESSDDNDILNSSLNQQSPFEIDVEHISVEKETLPIFLGSEFTGEDQEEAQEFQAQHYSDIDFESTATLPDEISYCSSISKMKQTTLHLMKVGIRKKIEDVDSDR